MIKLLIFFLLGKKLPFSNYLFSIVKSYLIVYLMILPVILAAQDFEWAKSRPLDYTLNPDMANFQVCTNDEGHVYWSGLSDFKEMYNSHAFGNIFIEKYSPDGVLIADSWIDGKVTLLDNEVIGNELYLAVAIRDDIEFSDGTILTFSGNEASVILVKLSETMDFLWSVIISDEFNVFSSGLTSDTNGNILIGYADYFNSAVWIFEENGSFVSMIEQQNVPIISSVDTDSENNIYVTGSCVNTGATFGGITAEPPFAYTVYVVKYNAQQQFEWVQFVEDVTCPFPTVVCNDPDFIYLAGELFFSTSFGPIQAQGPQWVFDFYIARLNANGDFMWVFETPEQNTLTGDASIGRLHGCDLDEDNNIFFGGFIRGELDWGNGLSTVSTNISYDLLALKVDTAGNLEYEFSGGGEWFDKATSIAADASGNVYLCGFGMEEVTFGEFQLIEEGTFPFLVKINNGQVSTSVNPKLDDHVFSIFPNPSKDYISINLNTPNELPAEIIISNQWGGIAYSSKHAINNQIPIGNFLNGLYFIQIKMKDSSILTGKFVKN